MLQSANFLNFHAEAEREVWMRDKSLIVATVAARPRVLLQIVGKPLQD